MHAVHAPFHSSWGAANTQQTDATIELHLCCHMGDHWGVLQPCFHQTAMGCPWSSDTLEPSPAVTIKLKSQLAQGGGQGSPGPCSIAVLSGLLPGLPHWARGVGALEVPSLCP